MTAIGISQRQAKTILEALTVVRTVEGLGTDTLTITLDTGEKMTLSAVGGVIAPVTPATAPDFAGRARRANALTRVEGLGTGSVKLYTWAGRLVTLDGFTGLFQAYADDQFIEGAALLAPGEGIASLQTNLVGAHNDVLFVASVAGTAGNAYSVTYVDPGAIDQFLSILLVGHTVTVSLGTNHTGGIITTAQQIVDEVASDGPIALGVYARLADLNDGTGVVTAMAETPLTGGV